MAHYLITGGSGLVGNRLTEILLKNNNKVTWLVRKIKPSKYAVNQVTWNIPLQKIDDGSFEGVDYIIHLAGAGVADKKWTEERKKEIISSRVESSKLLVKYLNANTHQIKAVCSASAVGYYGSITSNLIFSEQVQANNDFFGECCYLWEKEMQELNTNIPLSFLRIGIVLSNEGGALPKLTLPIKLGVGSPIGSGKQWMPWIHIDDLCAMFIHCVNNKLTHAHNAATHNTEQVNNKKFVSTIAKVLKRPMFFPKIPAKIIELIFGEMATVVLNGSRVDTTKINETKFVYSYANLETALTNLLKR